MGDGKRAATRGCITPVIAQAMKTQKVIAQIPSPISWMYHYTDPIAHRLITILAEKSAPTPPGNSVSYSSEWLPDRLMDGY